MSEQPKPCPFCGGEAISDGWVGCSNKDCDLTFCNFGVNIEVWNQRLGEATARREALNEVTKELIDQHQNPGEKIQLLTNWSARSVLKVITKLLEEKP